MIRNWDTLIETIGKDSSVIGRFLPEDIENYIHNIYIVINNEITSKYKTLPFQEHDNVLFLVYDNKMIFELGVVNTEDGSFIYCNNKFNGQEVTISTINARSVRQTCNDFRSFVYYAIYEASLWLDAKTVPIGSYPLNDNSVKEQIQSFIDSINKGNFIDANSSSQYLFEHASSIIKEAKYYLAESYPDVSIWKNGSSEIALYRYLPFVPFVGGALGLIITSENDYSGMVGLYNIESNSESISLFMDTLKSYLPASSYSRIRNISLSLPDQFHNISNDQVLDLLNIVVNTTYVINHME